MERSFAYKITQSYQILGEKEAPIVSKVSEDNLQISGKRQV